ncbi:MAG: hypothetical protein ACE5EE_10935 [Fidelibacterota bacterium]
MGEKERRGILTLKISNHEFSRPFESVTDLKSAPGLFAIVYVGETGTAILMEVNYGSNVMTDVEATVTDPAWQERTKGGQLRYGVRYANDSSEQELKRILKNLKDQYLVTCIL